MTSAKADTKVATVDGSVSWAAAGADDVESPRGGSLCASDVAPASAGADQTSSSRASEASIANASADAPASSCEDEATPVSESFASVLSTTSS